MRLEKANGKPKRYKSRSIDQIAAELIGAGRRNIRSEMHKSINCIWNEERKEWIILPICKKGDKTHCSNYRGVSLL